MAQTSVTQFAGELKVQPSVLLEQLKAAGVHKQLAEDTLSEQDKTRLLEYLRKVHGATEAKSKITLTRKQTSEIKKSDSTGKSRTIQVEVKKKRVFVKRDAAAEAPAEARLWSRKSRRQRRAGGAGGRPPAVDAQQLELREQEQKRQAALMARQSEELREKQEREKKLAEVRGSRREKGAAGASQAPAAEAPPPRTARCTSPRSTKPPRARRKLQRKRRRPSGRTKPPSGARSRRAATSAAPRAGIRRKGRATRLLLRWSRHRPSLPRRSRWCAKSWSRRPSPSPISRTRCR